MNSPLAERLAQARTELMRYRYQEAITLLEELLADLEQVDDASMRSDALELAGEAAMGLAEFGQAEEYFTQVLAGLDLEGEQHRMTSCQLGLAECHLRHGDFRQSRYLIELCLQRSSAHGWMNFKARALLQLGNLCWLEGDMVRAIEHLEQAVALFDELGLEMPASRARSSLGISYNIVGRSAEALAMFERALAYFQEIGDFTQVVRCLNNLAGIAFLDRDWQRARAHLLECVQLETEIRNRADLALSWYNLGLIELRMKDYRQARKYLNRGFQLAQEVSDRVTEASSLMQLGIVSLLEADPVEAVNFAKLAHSRLEASPSGRAATLKWLAAVFSLAASQVAEAAAQWDSRPEMTDPDGVATILELLHMMQSPAYQAAVEMAPAAAEKIETWICELETIEPEPSSNDVNLY